MLKRTGQEDLGILKEELPEKDFLTKKNDVALWLSLNVFMHIAHFFHKMRKGHTDVHYEWFYVKNLNFFS